MAPRTRRRWIAVLVPLLAAEAAGAVPLPIAAVDASADDGNPPGNVLDDDSGTRWSAAGPGQWIRFDLGARVHVAHVSVLWHRGDERSTAFELQGSNDGHGWAALFSGRSSGTAGFERYNVPPSPWRFVRLVAHGNSVNAWNSIAEVRIDSEPASTDAGGIVQIYPSRPGGEAWRLGVLDPNADPRFDPQAALVANADGSWRFADDARNVQARLSARTSSGYDAGRIVDDHAVLAERGYMQDARDWRNVEMTGYVRVEQVLDAGDEVTWYARGGKHSRPEPFCEGVAYKGDLKFAGAVRVAKEPWHVDYHFRPGQGVPATSSILGRWVGFKTILLNVGTEPHVRIELWLDAQNTNTWERVYSTTDAGGWGDAAFRCGDVPADQIITWGGPLAVFRWDNVRRIAFRGLSVREIVATSPSAPLHTDGFETP